MVVPVPLRDYITFDCACVGPLLDDWLKGGTPKALKGLSSVITLVYVCLYQSQNRKGREILPSLHII